MIKSIILIAGIALAIINHFISVVPENMQFMFFITGIVLLGIPHGAADLLVATKNSAREDKYFSLAGFFFNYLGRLVLFGLVIWLFPVGGISIFIVFAAYHFGQTDLIQFKTQTLTGKLLVISYGFTILATILLLHFKEVQPIFQQLFPGLRNTSILNWINEKRYLLSVLTALFFLVNCSRYFLMNPPGRVQMLRFFIQMALIMAILAILPMLAGFTFYFVIWHSILSLRNIVRYLQGGGTYSTSTILRQICLYSVLALAGITLVGVTGYMFIDHQSVIIYVILGLAVLTAPHMNIMDHMYANMFRRSGSVGII